MAEVPEPRSGPGAAADSSLGSLHERIEHEAARLATAVWVDEVVAWSGAAFERAAQAALRAPVLAERSVHLRRLLRPLVPAPVLPYVRRGVRLLDAASRRAFAFAEERRTRGPR